jgi:peroxin-11B
MKCWLFGIALSLFSSSASLVKLRADGRRFALSQEMAKREARNEEKDPAQRASENDERREKGRALLALVSDLSNDPN